MHNQTRKEVLYMYGKALSRKECERILKNNGFFFARSKGDHLIYKNAQGRTFVITSKISQKTWKRNCKREGIKED